MKKITAFIALVFLLCLSSIALSQEAYVKGGRIVFSDLCPEGCSPVSGKLFMGVGEQYTLDGAAKTTSSNPGILSADENGTLTAVKAGNATLRAYFSEKESIDLSVQVKKAPVSISVSRKSGVMDLGGHYQLTHTLSKDSAGRVLWLSSDPSVVSVDGTGRLTANGVGQCTITVSTYNGLTDQCAVRVKMPDPATVKLSASKGTMYPGENYLLGCTLEGGYLETLAWSSSDDSIVSVSQIGLLTAHAEGACTIRVTASGGGSDECAVTVLPGSSSIALDEPEITLYENGRAKIKPSIEGGSGRYELYSMDESLVVIDEETGEIHAKRAGSAYILFMTPNYLIAECMVHVVSSPETLSLTPTDSVFASGESAELFLNLDGYEKLPVAYEVSDSEVASVSDDGRVIGKTPGETAITAYTGGRQAVTRIEIRPIATAIKLNIGKNRLGVGESVSIETRLSGGEGRVSFSSDRPSVAAVDERTGVVTALSEGNCVITARLANGVSASLEIRVFPAPVSFRMNRETAVIGTGDAHMLSYTLNEGAEAAVSFTCSDPSLIDIRENILYASQTVGTCTVYAKTHNGLSAEISIVIKDPPEKIGVNAALLSAHEDFDSYILLKKGAIHFLSPVCEGYQGQMFTIVSSHPNIASVDDAGVITAAGRGTALVNVSLLSGASERILVIVE